MSIIYIGLKHFWYALCFFLPIVFIVGMIIIRKKRRGTKAYFAAVTLMLYALSLLMNISFPFYYNPFNKKDLTSIAELLQVQQSDSAENLQLENPTDYLQNRFVLIRFYDSDGANRSEVWVNVYKFLDAEVAKEEYDFLSRAPYMNKNRKYEDKGRNFEAFVSSVRVERFFPLPPFTTIQRYGWDIWFRYENYVVEISESGTYPRMYMKDVLFFLLEQECDLEYWLTHDMSNFHPAKGEYFDDEHQSIEPERRNWIS